MIAGDPLGEEAITAIFSPEKRGYNPFGTRYVQLYITWSLPKKLIELVIILIYSISKIFLNPRETLHNKNTLQLSDIKVLYLQNSMCDGDFSLQQKHRSLFSIICNLVL